PFYGLYTEDGYDPVNDEGYGTWVGQSVGTWEGVPIDLGGEWDNYLLYNDYGNLCQGGYGYGGFGFAERSDNGNYDFLAIGVYGEGGYGGAYLWEGYYEGGGEKLYIDAFAGGLMKAATAYAPYGTMTGNLAALYTTSSGEVGLMSGPLSGGFIETYSDDYNEGLWMVESGASGLTTTAKPVPEDFDIEKASIGSGLVSGEIGGNFSVVIPGIEGEPDITISGGGVAGYGYGGVEFFAYYTETDEFGDPIYDKSLPFGIYALSPQEAYYWGKPTAEGPVSWNAAIGGHGSFGYGGYDDYQGNEDLGYWFANITGVWEEDGGYGGGYGGGTIAGGLFGRYVTYNQMGTMSGSFDGLYTEEEFLLDEGTWVGQSVGTFDGAPTDFGGDWYHGLYYDNDGYTGDAGGNYGMGSIFGFQKRSDNENYDFLAIGEYGAYGYGIMEFGGPYLWNGDLDNREESVSRNLSAFTGGIMTKAETSDSAGTLTGNVAALYFTEDNKAGLIAGSVNGSFLETYYDYDWDKMYGIWMVESVADGLTGKEIVAPSDFNADEASISDRYMNYISAAGTFGSAGGEIRGASDCDWQGETQFISYNVYYETDQYLGTKSLPFGIYSVTLEAGNDYNSYSGKPAGDTVWSARIGGDGYFGSWSDPYSFGDDYGYWLADVAGMWEDCDGYGGYGGTITGDLTGKYVSYNQMGTISGPFYGLYTEEYFEEGYGGYGSWVGESVGTFESTVLNDFGGDWGSGLFYNDYG
ncbi:MAG: hypothetical protein JW765_04220, partial [Deltaproteobacteria bacterium]|nr:hypothetical protein [Candidatus Zymogenaceae bacterium]